MNGGGFRERNRAAGFPAIPGGRPVPVGPDGPVASAPRRVGQALIQGSVDGALSYCDFPLERNRAAGGHDPRDHLTLKAAETDQSLSELVNAAIRRSLAEDAEDPAVFEARAREPNLPFESVLKDLRRRGKL
jgi:hypothetical protein